MKEQEVWVVKMKRGSVQEEDVGDVSQGTAIDGPQIPQFHQGRVSGTSGYKFDVLESAA